VSNPDASSRGRGLPGLSTLQRGVRRLGWGLGDQAVSSLTNFTCGVTAAHLLAAEQLGAYSLAFVTYAVALNCSRGLATDPLMVRVAGADDDTRRRAVRQCAGTALLVGAVTGSALVLLALLLPPPIQGALLALGAVMPALMLQDSWRFAFFVGGRGSKSVVNDMVWGLALVPALLLVATTGHHTAFWFILAWGGAASVAALLGLWQARIVPRPDNAWAWLHTHRDLGVRYMVEGVAGSLADQIRAYGIGIAVGLAAVGYLQVVNTLMGPLMILRLGIGAVIVPELAMILRQSPRRMQHACLLLSAALAGTAALWGIVLWIGVPHGLGAVVVGDYWHSAAPLIPLATLGIVAASIPAAAGSGLHALGAARRSLRAMLIGAALYASMSVGGAIVAKLPGALLGTALAYFIGGGLWWRELRKEIRTREAAVAEGSRYVAAEVSIASARNS
jgi:O-antigen/teichoic acid export membrane protein